MLAGPYYLLISLVVFPIFSAIRLKPLNIQDCIETILETSSCDVVMVKPLLQVNSTQVMVRIQKKTFQDFIEFAIKKRSFF